MKYSKFIKKTIRVRKKIIQLKIGKKNVAKSFAIIKKLETQIDAYSNVWNEVGWKRFLQRNYDNILFLIPSNSTTNKSVETLNKLTK